MTRIPFFKAHGTGNDFIIFIDDHIPAIIRSPDFIRRICRRRTGIGADAVMILSQVQGYDYQMDYYNSDGTWETMCANGSRCSAMVMFHEGLTGKEISFLTGDGPHKIKIIDNKLVKLQMAAPVYKSGPLNVNHSSGYHVDSGATHFVSEKKGVTQEFAEQEAPGIRYDPQFAPRGINVNFYDKTGSSKLEVVTYEKGIEKVMLSCGSGSVAAAYHVDHDIGLTSPVEISVPGGKLVVEFDPHWKQVWLTGPAVVLFKSDLNPEDF